MWHSLSKKEVLAELKTTEEGLSNKEALIRLEKYGLNELKQILGLNPLLIFFEQFKSIFIIILLFAALFSFFIGHYIDFSAIAAIVLLNSIIGFFQQYKAEKTIAEMRDLLIPKVRVFRGGKLEEIDSSKIALGDILVVSEGDKIMADCRIIHSNELETNEAVLTGESFPQAKSSVVLKLDTELANRENMLYMGTSAVRGSGKAVVVLTGMNTEFGRIAKMVQAIKAEKTPLEKKLDSFSKKVAVVVMILAAISIFIGIMRGEDIYHMFLTGIALAISVIPEGVPAVIAITFALAIRRMQKYNALIRKLPAAETLGRTTVICTDKTGALTEEEMAVTKLYCNKELYTINNSSFFCENRQINPERIKELNQLLKIGIMCNNARIEKSGKKITNIFGDPTERALLTSADKAGILKKEETEKEIRLKEYSFSSKRKMMSIVRKADKALISYVKGAPDIILKKCSYELINGEPVPLSPNKKAELVAIYENFSSQALRVLGFAFRIVPQNYNQETAESELIFAGFQGMMDPPRKEVADAVKECLFAGIKIKMLTGDSLLTAIAVGNMIGLDGKFIEEYELEKLSEKEFYDAVRTNTIFARITPETKLRIIKTLKEQNEIVAVTGDGINDVLALKAAHIGVAMGIRGTDVARDVSDIILLDDNFSSIVSAIREGRRVYDNMKKSITAHIAANVDEIFVVLFALLLAWPLPLMPLAILWMNLITDSLPSLSLSVEPADKNIMKREPISSKETILTGTASFWLVAGIFAFIATIGLFSLYFKADLEKARTIALTTAVFCEMFVVLSCRSRRNIWEIGLFSNKFLLYSIIFAVCLQLIAIYSPLALVFGFVPLSLMEILLIVVAALPIFIIFEVWKFWQSRKFKE
jgi:Ca2+-transporting ATPase